MTGFRKIMQTIYVLLSISLEMNKLFNICSIFCKVAKILCNSSHKIQKINENDMFGFPYDREFVEAVLKKYPQEIINKMLKYGDLKIGLLLKRLEGESGLYDYWMEQYSKKYSPLGYYKDFDEPMEERYGMIFDKLVGKIKQ